MFEKIYDIFIAYHGSYDAGSAVGVAEQVYEYLTSKGLKCFFFPKTNRDVYKRNIIDAMRSKKFLLVCNEKLKITPEKTIDPGHHYELLTEIDAFYSLTQLGDDVRVIDSKVLVCGDYMNERRKGDECKYHPLFANRVHLYYSDEDKENIFNSIFEWCKDNKFKSSSKSGYKSRIVSNEVKQVLAMRSSLGNAMDLNEKIAQAHSIYAIGISNTELTYKMDPEAIKYAIENGCKIECIFLDPEGQYTKIREKEEGITENKIKDTTIRNINCAKDIIEELDESLKCNFKIYKYDLNPRMNILIIDDTVILQYYANFVQGMQNPCFLIEKQENNSPLYDFCMNSFQALKEKSLEVE